jgi:hypothetical protein
MSVMMFRAVICCVALIAGLLAALNVTAESAGACNGTTCGKPQPLNLMNFMNGSGQSGSTQAATVTSTAPATTKTATTKHRHHKAKTATRSNSDATPPSTAASEQPALPAAAATAYTAHSTDDVQVVSGEEVNAIDLAMGKADAPAAETNGVSPGAENDNRDRVKWVDANEFRADQYKPSATPAPVTAPASDSTLRDDSWMGRFWSTIGDGYVALIAMIKQLFS